MTSVRQPPTWTSSATPTTEFRLVGDVYERAAEHRGRAALGLGVTVDLDAL